MKNKVLSLVTLNDHPSLRAIMKSLIIGISINQYTGMMDVQFFGGLLV